MSQIDGSEPLFAGEACMIPVIEGIQKHQPEAAKAHLAAGRAIYYGDPRYPGQIVKEYPDGRRQLVHIDEKSVVTVIKEI